MTNLSAADASSWADVALQSLSSAALDGGGVVGGQGSDLGVAATTLDVTAPAGIVPSSHPAVMTTNDPPPDPLIAAADLGLLHLPPLHLPPIQRPSHSTTASPTWSASIPSAPPILGSNLDVADRGSAFSRPYPTVGDVVASLSPFPGAASVPGIGKPTTVKGSPSASSIVAAAAAAPWPSEHPEAYGHESGSEGSERHSRSSSRQGRLAQTGDMNVPPTHPAVERPAQPQLPYQGGGSYGVQGVYGWSGGGGAYGGDSRASAQASSSSSAGAAAYGSTGGAGYAPISGAYAPSYLPPHHQLPLSSTIPLAARLEGRPHLSHDKAAIVRDRVRTVLLEDMKTSVYQVEVHRVTIARMQGTNRVNATKLLNAANITRGKRDGILKNEKDRDIVKQGTMPLKGQWVPLERARKLASQFNLAQALYPLLEDDLPEYVAAVGPLTPRYGALATYLPPSDLTGPSASSGSSASPQPFTYPSRPQLGIPSLSNTTSSSSSSTSAYYGPSLPTLHSGGGSLQLPSQSYASGSYSVTPYTTTYPLPSIQSGLLSPRPDMGERRRTFPLAGEQQPALGYAHEYPHPSLTASTSVSGQSSMADRQPGDYHWSPVATSTSRPATYGSPYPTSYVPAYPSSYGQSTTGTLVPRALSPRYPVEGQAAVSTARTISAGSEAAWRASPASESATGFSQARQPYAQSTSEWLESTGLGYQRDTAPTTQ